MDTIEQMLNEVADKVEKEKTTAHKKLLAKAVLEANAAIVVTDSAVGMHGGMVDTAVALATALNTPAIRGLLALAVNLRQAKELLDEGGVDG